MSKTIIRGYKYRIYPTEEQKNKLDRFIDLFRYVYNWGIAKEREVYEKSLINESDVTYYSFYDLCHMLINERNKPGNEWLKEIPLTTSRLALRNITTGYSKFFNKYNLSRPNFKSKKHSKHNFNTRNDRFKIKHDCIRIEGISTYISLGFDCGLDLDKVSNPTISKDKLGNYYVSFTLEEEVEELSISKTDGIGIDLGIRRTLTLSTGEIFNQPNERIDKLERKRKRQQRHVAHDVNRRLNESKHTKTKYEDIPKSKRSIKRENKLRKLYRKIHNVKNTFYHTITKQIVMRNPKYVCMETFSSREICGRNKYMNKLLTNVSTFTITTMMKYKCEKYNIPFIQAPREFPSTKMCSNCGSIKKMYNYHTYKCPICGMVEDRDINAAINLMNYGSQFI